MMVAHFTTKYSLQMTTTTVEIHDKQLKYVGNMWGIIRILNVISFQIYFKHTLLHTHTHTTRNRMDHDDDDDDVTTRNLQAADTTTQPLNWRIYFMYTKNRKNKKKYKIETCVCVLFVNRKWFDNSANYRGN